MADSFLPLVWVRYVDVSQRVCPIISWLVGGRLVFPPRFWAITHKAAVNISAVCVRPSFRFCGVNTHTRDCWAKCEYELTFPRSCQNVFPKPLYLLLLLFGSGRHGVHNLQHLGPESLWNVLALIYVSAILNPCGQSSGVSFAPRGHWLLVLCLAVVLICISLMTNDVEVPFP